MCVFLNACVCVCARCILMDSTSILRHHSCCFHAIHLLLSHSVTEVAEMALLCLSAGQRVVGQLPFVVSKLVQRACVRLFVPRCCAARKSHNVCFSQLVERLLRISADFHFLAVHFLSLSLSLSLLTWLSPAVTFPMHLLSLLLSLLRSFLFLLFFFWFARISLLLLLYALPQSFALKKYL